MGIDCGVTTSCNVDCLDCMFVLTWWSGPKKFTDCFVSVGSLTSSSTALASPMTPMGFFVFLCWSRRRLSGALELELRTGGDTTKGGERETHQWAGALRLTPICEAEKARRPSPRGVLDGGDDDVGHSNRLGAAALNRDRVRVIGDNDGLLLFTRRTLKVKVIGCVDRCLHSRDIASSHPPHGS